MERGKIIYVRKNLVWAGIVLMIITALIHFVDAPDAFGEVAYKGWLFVANGVGALIAAVGIWRGARGWGWGLGLVVAAGAIVGYAISRTVGMPGLGVDPWMEPLGVASLIAEGLFTLIALKVLSSGSR